MAGDEPITYRAVGVDYDLLDAGKRAAIAAALATSSFGQARGATAVDASRGEPAFLVRFHGLHLAMVLECLGTKSMLARQFQEEAGIDRFEWTGLDTVAAIVNDLCSVGALPLVVNAYFATGSDRWYAAGDRFSSLVRGWQAGCEQAGAIWGGGESPMLHGIVADDEIDLAGSAFGFVPEGRPPLLGDRLQAGDEIVLVASTGLHANGASLARRAVAEAGGLSVRLADGTLLGDALLAPSASYVRLLDSLYRADVPLSYISHITGHGLRKLMRANRELSYRITALPPVPPALQFIVDTLRLPVEEAYGTFNMGAGLALFCPAGEGRRAVEVAAGAGYEAMVAGVVEAGPRRVLLEPVGVTFQDEELQLR
ncbi:MAG TPA: AIR synthase-related protein [Natronosporangium sp.]